MGGGWSEDWIVMLNSTQDQVEVEFEGLVELGNMVQATRHKKQGETTSKGYIIFEKYRENINVGIFMSAVQENLKQNSIHDDNPELLLVCIDINGNFGSKKQ